MLKISYADCLGLSPAIWRNSLLKWVSQRKIVKKFVLKPAILGVKFKVIDVNISKNVVGSACCDKQHVCAILKHFYAQLLVSLTAKI